MNNIAEVKDSIIKPSFDGRQHFYKILGDYQITLAEARYFNDYVTMEKSLRGFLQMVNPYIKTAESKTIKTLLDQTKKFLKPQFIKIFSDYIETLLDKATFKLFVVSKHMLLPFSEDDDGEMDWEQFMKESDL